MAYVHASMADIVSLLEAGGYALTKENMEQCLHEVYGFSKQRRGEFGVESRETALKEVDIGKNRWYTSEVQKHKSKFNGYVECVYYIGYERKDAIWLEEGNPSEEILMEIRNDPSYNLQIAQLGKQRSVS